MIVYCTRCGAEFPTRYLGAGFETDRRCSECGVAAADPPALLAPSEAELTYGLDEWPVADRTILTDVLGGDGIPYRWEAGYVLAVPDAVEALVDGILDDLEGSADPVVAPGERLDGLVAPGERLDGLDGLGQDGLDEQDGLDGLEQGGQTDGGPGPDGGDDVEGLVADGGEEAQAAMSDLFVLADRLSHAPHDRDLADELSVVADFVAASLPPYGMDAPTWLRIHELAVAIDEADTDDETAERSVTLRDFLRQYV